MRSIVLCLVASSALAQVPVDYDGKPNSKKVKYRDVRIAMPRLFESSGK